MSNRLPPSVVVALLLAALLAACGDDASPGQPDAGVDAGLDVGKAECTPLGGVRCALPLPSSIYQRADMASATGVRLDFPSGSLPTNGDGVTVDPATVNGRDGFSPSAQIFTVFPGGVDPANLPPITDPGQSLAAASPTVLLDMGSGERVLHFAEVDAEAGVLPGEEAVIIPPP